MFRSIFLSGVFLFGVRAAVIQARSSSSSGYVPPGTKCVDYEIPISYSVPGNTFVAKEWSDNYDLTDFVSLAATRPSANFSQPIAPGATLTGNYTISGTFCSPVAKNEHSSTILLATHGLGFERGYWNSVYQPENYNFVQHVTGKGYSVFFYDRLGTGKSSVGEISGFVNQASIQQEILSIILKEIKDGRYVDDLGKPDKVVLVGHSFGSFIGQGLLAADPSSADGAILTGLGYSLNSPVSIEAFVLRISATQDEKFSNRDKGYVTWSDVYANINNFFKAPYYTTDTTAFAEDNKQPFAITELLSIATINLNAQAYTGPVLIQNGEYDFIVCQGYCPGVVEAPAAQFFSGSKLKIHYQPGTGHGLNYHKNATAGYQVITDYLSSNGL